MNTHTQVQVQADMFPKEKRAATKPISQKFLVSTYGCNKYQLGDVMRNNLHVPTDKLKALEIYHMLHMPGHILRNLLVDGTITHSIKDSIAVRYAVIYQGCFPHAAKKAHELRLSFRAAKPEFGIEPIVLVRIVSENLL
jgi:hypothetical protein